MSVDQPSQEGAPSEQGANHPADRILTDERQIIWQSDREQQAYAMLHERAFVHTCEIDRDLLNATGMTTEFQTIFRILGWENAWIVNEQGCRELTLEFLCTLEITNTHCTFRLFNEDHSFTWKHFSVLLGFDKNCATDLSKACRGFDKKTFWKEISGRREMTYPRNAKIHNPTLRFLHKSLQLLFILEMIPA